MNFKEFKNRANESNSDLFDYYYHHIPSGTDWKLNGAGGLVRMDDSSNSVLPTWLKDDSKDWVKKDKG